MNHKKLFKYPKYTELPSGLMFIGEIVDYVNGVHKALPSSVRRNKVFTSAMASNYIKAGLTPPAIGRRYNRDHLSLILFAATIKLMFSAEEVINLTQEAFSLDKMEECHDKFAQSINRTIGQMKDSDLYHSLAEALCARINALENLR